jgi:predicted nucleic acid-binding protein
MNSIKECWDTNLFVSFLNDSPQEKGKVDIVETLIKRCQKPKSNIIIVVSTIVISEVQPRDQYNQEHWDIVQDLFFTARHFIKVQVVTPKIAQVASMLRAQYEKMHLADAIIMATASLEDCAILYTCDGSGKKPDPYDMLKFNGISVVQGKPPLNISIPKMPIDAQLPL